MAWDLASTMDGPGSDPVALPVPTVTVTVTVAGSADSHITVAEQSLELTRMLSIDAALH